MHGAWDTPWMAMFAHTGTFYCGKLIESEVAEFNNHEAPNRCLLYPESNASGPQSKFQVMPLMTAPFQPPPGNPPDYNTYCDPARPQTPHPGGMTALFADGHVTSLADGLDPIIWWALCTPNGKEKVPDDF